MAPPGGVAFVRGAEKVESVARIPALPAHYGCPVSGRDHPLELRRFILPGDIGVDAFAGSELNSARGNFDRSRFPGHKMSFNPRRAAQDADLVFKILQRNMCPKVPHHAGKNFLIKRRHERSPIGRKATLLRQSALCRSRRPASNMSPNKRSGMISFEKGRLQPSTSVSLRASKLQCLAFTSAWLAGVIVRK
jgi:hypothetical protein